MRAAFALIAAALAGCYPTTTRPEVTPSVDAAFIEIDEFVPAATTALAMALHADSIPVRRTEPGDGWLETEWFDAGTLRPTGQRPLGAGVVMIRALVDPGRPNHSVITVQVLHRPLADPSRSAVDLDVEVPPDHPVAVRVRRILNGLALAGVPRLP